MGITYRHIPQHRLIIEVWDGVITVDQWRTHLQRYLADPALAALDRSLVDVSTADTSLLTDADEAEIVARYVSARVHARADAQRGDRRSGVRTIG